MNKHEVEGLMLWGQRSTHRGQYHLLVWLCEHAPWRPGSAGEVTMWGVSGSHGWTGESLETIVSQCHQFRYNIRSL